MIPLRIIRLLNTTVLILALLVIAFLVSREAVGQSASSANIKVIFKLDPSLTRGMYMGDRWVSPPTYTSSQSGKTATIEAKVSGFNKGIKPTWTPSDPKMVKVTPQQ